MKMKPKLLKAGAALSLCAGVSPAAMAAYNMADYYPLSVGDTRVVFEKNPNGSYVGSETVTGTEMVNGVQTLKLSYGKPYANGESENMAWEAEGLKIRQMVSEDNGVFTTNVCSTPYVILPAQMELGQTYSSSGVCGTRSGTYTTTLEAVEDVSVEAGSFTGCLKVHTTIGVASIDERQWFCPGVGQVKVIGTDSDGAYDRQLRWATVKVNGVSQQYGTGEQTIGGIRTAFAAAKFWGDNTLELYNLYQGNNQFGARFALNPARIFFSYQANNTGNGTSIPGVTLGNAYVKVNGNQMTMYDITVNGAKYFAEWEFVTAPEMGYQIKNSGLMP